MERIRQENLVSVIIPTYNRQKKVVRALHSVLAQTHRDIEVIVSDDGSTDDTPRIMKECIAQHGPKIRYVRSEINRGVSAARNRGIELAQGEFIAFLDSDDGWEPQKIEMELKVARELGPDAFVFCAFRLCEATGEKTLELWPTYPDEGPCFLIPKENPLEKPIPPPGAWFISRSFIEKVGLFDEEMRTFEDAEFAYRIYAAGFKGYFIKDHLVRCHSDGDASSNLSVMSKETMRAKEHMVKKYSGRLTGKLIAQIYNSLSKDYLFFKDRKMASFSAWRAFLAYPIKLDYFGKVLRAWFLIKK